MKLVILLIGVLGCIPRYIPPSSYPAPEPVVIPIQPDSVWSAVVDVVTERGLLIQTIDRASGFLQTSEMRTRGSEYWDCGQEERPVGKAGRKELFSLADEYLGFFVTVSAVPRGVGETLLRVSVNPLVGWRRCVSKGVWETQLAQQILERWRELR